MTRNYKNIVAWQRAHQLTLAIYQHTKEFPSDEKFGITSQIRRAAYGVAANIVEGSARDSKKDYLRFLTVAMSSLKEVEYFLLLSMDLGYLESESFEEISEIVNGTMRPLHGLIQAVRQQVQK